MNSKSLGSKLGGGLEDDEKLTLLERQEALRKRQSDSKAKPGRKGKKCADAEIKTQTKRCIRDNFLKKGFTDAEVYKLKAEPSEES